ncbi:MAG TPA: hypothetical protein VF278_23620 [Pirellulales bacterium]
MNIEFYGGEPHTRPEAPILMLVAGARRIDAAVEDDSKIEKPRSVVEVPA